MPDHLKGQPAVGMAALYVGDPDTGAAGMVCTGCTRGSPVLLLGQPQFVPAMRKS